VQRPQTQRLENEHIQRALNYISISIAHESAPERIANEETIGAFTMTVKM
jgi:hypothetical protein